MIREILRAIGIGCIIAAGILYFIADSKVPSGNDTHQLQANVEKLQSELAKTKELLATAQTTSSVKESIPTTDAEKDAENKEDLVESKPSPDTTLKTMLTIENGSNSTVVSATLEELGIIENAGTFESYLEENNLTGKIQIGEHQVDSSMNFKTIAKEITTVKK